LKENLYIINVWKGCLSGDRKAQSELYKLFSGKMFAVCLRYAKDRMEAEDMLQTGFIKIFRSASTFTTEGSLEGWIRRIMVNNAIEIHRKNRVTFIDIDEIPSVDEHRNASYDTQLAVKDLMQLINALPIGYRTIFNLYAIEGYSHVEIAELLQISEGSSKSQLSRARAKLKMNLSKMEGISYE